MCGQKALKVVSNQPGAHFVFEGEETKSALSWFKVRPQIPNKKVPKKRDVVGTLFPARQDFFFYTIGSLSCLAVTFTTQQINS